MKAVILGIGIAVLAAAGCRQKAEPAPPGPGASEKPGGDGAGKAGQESFVPESRVYWNQAAGRFYPADAEELGKLVDKYVSDAGPAPAAVAGSDLLGFISPHAGYPYSGPVAGRAYALVSGRSIRTVVVMGLSHKGLGDRSAVLSYDSYRTPLGPVPIDTETVARLLEKGKGVIAADEAPFAQEHSLEVQLPFIQKTLPQARIVPIMVGHPQGAVDSGLVDLLYSELGSRSDVLFVASTDLSHYEPYDQATAKDNVTLDRIAALDWASLAGDAISEGRMCGVFTVGVLMALAGRYAGQAKGHRIEYMNSGDTAGDRSGGVVGYGVVAFTLPEGARSAQGAGAQDAASGPAPAAGGALTAAERVALLGIARKAAEAAVEKESFKPAVGGSASLEKVAAALVNIRIDGRPGGTGGSTEASLPLAEAVARAAQAAVADDDRYPAPPADEAASLECEVVVITNTWVLEDVDQYDPSVQGLVVRAGGLVGYVLPGEAAWSREEALAQGCRRVGLAPSCWKQKKQEVTPSFDAFSGERFADWDEAPGGK